MSVDRRRRFHVSYIEVVKVIVTEKKKKHKHSVDNDKMGSSHKKAKR